MQKADAMTKTEFRTIAEKNRTIRNLILAIEERDHFLLIGHKSPDEDCIASMVAFGLLLGKFSKKATIVTCQPVLEQFRYLIDICKFNTIEVFESCLDVPSHFSTVVLLDTPKPSMIDDSPFVSAVLADPKVLKIEIDHHLEADSHYNGDEGYRLVSGASSTCELIGLLGFKIDNDKTLLARHNIEELFSRNLVLAILTGILGDSKMGKYLKTRKERWFYNWFSSRFEILLTQKTFQGTGNYATQLDVFQAIAALNSEEESCFRYLMERESGSRYLRHVLLDEEASRVLHEHFNRETVTGVSKTVTDQLAETGGYLGLVSFFDAPADSNFLQFRLRRSQAFVTLDLREVLEKLQISNGGGHPGAVGFRYDRSEVKDYQGLLDRVLPGIEALVQAAL